MLGATICREDGIADPAGVTRELVRRAAALGVDVREQTDALELDADMLVVACGARSPAVAAARGVELPVRPLVRQLVDVGPVAGLPADLPMTIEERRLPLPPRRHRRAPARDGGAGAALGRAARRCDDDARRGLARAARRTATRARPARRSCRAWAGFYDMTPDAHPIIGPVADGVYAACGFSGHGFMQSPAVGDAVAAELLGEEPPFDLAPYRLERFAAGAIFPETLVL